MRRVLPLLVALCVAFAPAPLPRQARGVPDSERLEGTWRTHHGMEARFEGGKLLTFTQGGKLARVFRITLDPSSAPKAYDLVWLEGGAGFVKGGEINRGIYRLEGDTLVTCTRGWDQQRPTGFSEDERHFLMVFTRK